MGQDNGLGQCEWTGPQKAKTETTMWASFLTLHYVYDVGDGLPRCGGASFHIIDHWTPKILECKLFERSFLAFLSNTTRLV